MSASLCNRCGERVATLLGVPADRAFGVSRDTLVDRDVEDPGPDSRVSFRVEPEYWLRLCATCADQQMAAGKLVATFEIATWRDPRRIDASAS